MLGRESAVSCVLIRPVVRDGGSYDGERAAGEEEANTRRVAWPAGEAGVHLWVQSTEYVDGVLEQVNDRGIVLSADLHIGHPAQSLFYPWSAVVQLAEALDR